MAPLCHYGSSLRVATVETTLQHAAIRGPQLGISRVTDITALDRIGIPVFTAVRPNASRASLCVTAGKGRTPLEAKASAVMEAIEFALAEPGVSSVGVVMATAREVLDGPEHPDAILDFCPYMGKEIPLDAPLACVVAEDWGAETTCLIPAELVFLPAPPEAHPGYFGANTNGLASGNSREEAFLHGLCEVIERDIWAFNLIQHRSHLILPETLPPSAAELLGYVEAAGLSLFVRSVENDFQLPFFEAVLADPEALSPFLVNGGFGCHPHREIALMRAICEAAQSRLSVIHGGRDDLDETEARLYDLSPAQQEHQVQVLVARASYAENALSYLETPDCTAETPDIPTALRFLQAQLAQQGMARITVVWLTEPDEPLQVVKVNVPLLELFDLDRPRIGRRLKNRLSRLPRATFSDRSVSS